jgi:hypothetical protein
MLYQEEIPKPDDDVEASVNYGEFRNRLIPVVAEKKNLTTDQLMSKLAHYEELAHPELYKQVEVITVDYILFLFLFVIYTFDPVTFD